MAEMNNESELGTGLYEKDTVDSSDDSDDGGNDDPGGDEDGDNEAVPC